MFRPAFRQMSLVIFFLACGLALWLAALLWNWYNAQGVISLSAARDFLLPDHPQVAILIPARNEAEILLSSLPRLLEQDYENYQVILVDDAYTDGTAELTRQFLS